MNEEGRNPQGSVNKKKDGCFWTGMKIFGILCAIVLTVVTLAAGCVLYFLLGFNLRYDNNELVMTEPPARIAYPVGYEGEIDASGIVIKHDKGIFPKKYALADLDYTLSTDADFSVPGSYIVTVTVEDEGIEKVFWFTVAVCEGGE